MSKKHNLRPLIKTIVSVGGGYTVEGQITGEENFGGIQIEVIPSYKKLDRMSFSYETEEGMRRNVEEAQTPRDYGLVGGNKISVVPNPPTFVRPTKIRDFYSEGEEGGGVQCLLLKVSPSMTGDRRTATNLILKAEYPDYSRWLKENAKSSVLSSYTGSGDSHGGNSEYGFAELLCGSQGPSGRIVMSSPAGPGYAPMGIAAGGKLVQDIYADTNPKHIWNKSNTRLVNIHILNSFTFEEVTHIVPPPTPITANMYNNLKLPVFLLEEELNDRVDGGNSLKGIQSVSAMDKKMGIDGSSDTTFDPLKPKKCGTCEVRLCDCMCVASPPTLDRAASY